VAKGHFDEPRKHVVDKGVECFVHERPPREVRNGFELVVDEQLGVGLRVKGLGFRV
jgi:hypothetical protein